jgi:hypothetical protein
MLSRKNVKSNFRCGQREPKSAHCESEAHWNQKPSVDSHSARFKKAHVTMSLPV